MKCAHTVLPFVTLVTSTNKSLLCDVLSILEIGGNGKQYCLSVSYKEYDQCYHKYNVTYKGHIGEYDQQDLPHLCIM